MRKIGLVAAMTWVASSSVYAEVADSTMALASAAAISTEATPHLQELNRPLADMARTIGLGREEYLYNVEWSLLKVGKATLGATEIVNVDSTTAYHIVSTARTLPFLDAFHRVRDRNEAWLDTKSFLSIGFGKYLREGHFFRDETVVFNHASGTLRATVRKKNGAVVLEELPMKPYAYDVLSALYWVRSQDLVLGREFSIDVNTRQDWPLLVRVLRQERIKVAAGEFDCFVLEPVMREEGIFVQKGKSMHIWVTRDSRKIPVQIKADVFIGAVRAELEEIVYKK